MNTRPAVHASSSRLAAALIGFATLCTLGACVGVGEYDRNYRTTGEISIGYGVGFYEPYGYYDGFGGYGGYNLWRNDYRVGPPLRGSYQRSPQFRPQRDRQSYQVAPHTRPIPSIPSAPRAPRPDGGNRGNRGGDRR